MTDQNSNITAEKQFQNDIISQMQAHGWQLGNSADYDRENAIIQSDVLHYIKITQAEEWQKFCAIYPKDTEKNFISLLVKQLAKAKNDATSKESRTYGTLGVLRHGLKTRNVRFSLCQFKPENSRNPTILEHYRQNICRMIPELVYSPYATPAELTETGTQAKKYRIDLVLFINGLPVATLELKSEFKQSVDNATTQYKTTRNPTYANNKIEPLLTFKRGALVHFAVSQYQVYMTSHLKGKDSNFLPFNQGTSEGGAGNDVPDNKNQYATAYLWNEVLTPDNLLNIIARYIHLQIEDTIDWEGNKDTVEKMIFPRFHQWRAVNRLLNEVKTHGTGHRYLIQHSAGSGKSNSIAWLAHQLSSLNDAHNNRMFDSVIVITDRTVLDDQLQDTIYQFEHKDGVVGKINRKEGTGSKSEKLAEALEHSQRIIIVTIQTFNHVLDAIENSAVLKDKRYAIIADEAHSSQTGKTARKVKSILKKDDDSEQIEQTSEDMLDKLIEDRKGNPNLNYYAFTATPKAKTLELFGQLPDPTMPPSKDNKPEAFDVYSMRQAIEEKFILDVLKNYTNYKLVYKLKQNLENQDQEVDSKKAHIKLSKWVRMHEYNISQKVITIVEHFNKHVKHLLDDKAKAMVVTSSRKEAVRYKLAFDKYIAEQGYKKIHALVAFSGEVEFNADDKDSSALLGQTFSETSITMNPNLHGRDMREAFNTDDYQVMLVANKFQTGFDQPKLCAMYVDKKLGGVECVQTLSRLNRTYPNKTKTFILDFYNDPDDVLEAFQAYYEIAEIDNVTDPDLIFEMFDKLCGKAIFTWQEVEQFIEAFLTKNKSPALLSNLIKPAVERWQKGYRKATENYQHVLATVRKLKGEAADKVTIGNAKLAVKNAKAEVEDYLIFKKDLGSFARFYELMSQIVDYDDKNFEKLTIFIYHLLPSLHESHITEDDIDLSNVEMSHYRLSKIREQDLKLQEDSETPLQPITGIGTGQGRGAEEEWLSVIIDRLNGIFITDNLSDSDMINYAYTIRDKLVENELVMQQIANNSREQAMLGDFPEALDDAIVTSHQAHKEQMMQLLADPSKAQRFAAVVYEMLSRVN